MHTHTHTHTHTHIPESSVHIFLEHMHMKYYSVHKMLPNPTKHFYENGQFVGSNKLPHCIQKCINPYPTVFPYGNSMVLHFYQQQESSTTKTVHKVINKGLTAYV